VFTRAIALLAFTGMLAGVTTAGASAANMKETIHLAAPTGMSSLHMTMATAKVTYTAHDVSVKLAAAHLPAPSTIHKSKFYVVWLKQGSKNYFVGDLKMTGARGGLTAMVMIKKFQDITVTAATTAHPMHAMGTVVLSGMSHM
jgi:hypothetical protein